MSAARRQTLQLDSLRSFDLRFVQAGMVTYRGRRAVRLVESDENPADEQTVAPAVSGSEFKDGVVEIDIAGMPRADAPQDARGFVGVAFRVHPAARQFECFYLRPTNGRADDQLRRNHSTQYVSHPDYPWFRLRDESPGVYESYADLEFGRVDDRPNRGLRDPSVLARERSPAALPRRERPEAWGVPTARSPSGLAVGRRLFSRRRWSSSIPQGQRDSTMSPAPPAG